MLLRTFLLSFAFGLMGCSSAAYSANTLSGGGVDQYGTITPGHAVRWNSNKKLEDAGTFLSYTGTGATGTWPISITGNAGTVTTLSAGQLPLLTATTPGAAAASGGGTTNFLRADGAWAAPSGSGGAMVYPAAGLALSTGTAWGSPVPYGATGNSTLVQTSATGLISSAVVPTLNQNTTGNAATATTLATSRTIAIGGSTGLTAAGVNFNGSSNISLTLSGTVNAANLPAATSSTAGAVTCGSGTTCTAGVISVTGGGSLDASGMDAFLGTSGSAQGIIGRLLGGTYALITGGPIKAEMYGVADTGSNVSTALQTAINDAVALGRPLELPKGTLLATATFPSNLHMYGQGRFQTTIKTPNSTNLTTLTSTGAAGLWGGGTNGGVSDVNFHDFAVDGNRANNTTGDCIDYYGAKFDLRSVLLKNCAYHGLRTEWAWGGEPVGGMEGNFSDIIIDTTGRHGWYYDGPHDSVANDVIIIDASQTTANTYSSLYLSSKNLFSNKFHTWTRSASNEPKYSLEEVIGNIVDFGSTFESAATAAVYLTSNQNQLHGTVIMQYNHGATNSVVPLILYGNSGNVIDATITCSGTNPIYGAQIGASGNTSEQNMIRLSESGCASGAVDMTYTSGANTIDINGYDIGPYPYKAGDPYDNDRVDITSSSVGTHYHYDKSMMQNPSYTSAHTMGLSDASGVVSMNCSSPCDLTIPPDSTTNFPVWTTIPLYRKGSSTVTLVAGSGVTIHTTGTLTMPTQYGRAFIQKIDANEWTFMKFMQ